MKARVQIPIMCAWVTILFLPALFSDQLELLNGQRMQGDLVKMTDATVTFRIKVGERHVPLKYSIKKVHAVTTEKGRVILNEKSDSPTNTSTKSQQEAKSGPKKPSVQTNVQESKSSVAISRNEILALIDKAGRTPPDWWDTVQLSYPNTLDMSWPAKPPTKGWDPRKNVGQYMWSVVNENPRHWRGGTKFMLEVMKLNKSNPDVIQRAIGAMAHIYTDLLEDHARGAFWLQQQLKKGRANLGAYTKLAYCYWKLGSPDMAREILRKVGSDNSRTGSVIKMWADLGDLKKALSLAAAKATGSSYVDAAYLAAGDACRVNGKYDQAMAYYEKIAKMDKKKAGRDYDRVIKRAAASLQAIQLFEKLDVTNVADGTYKSNSLGYEAPVHIEVSVAAGKITALRVTQHREKQYYSSLTDVPSQIIKKNSVKGVDATASATITGEAIINATAKALYSGLK